MIKNTAYLKTDVLREPQQQRNVKCGTNEVNNNLKRKLPRYTKCNISIQGCQVGCSNSISVLNSSDSSKYINVLNGKSSLCRISYIE